MRLKGKIGQAWTIDAELVIEKQELRQFVPLVDLHKIDKDLTVIGIIDLDGTVAEFGEIEPCEILKVLL